MHAVEAYCIGYGQYGVVGYIGFRIRVSIDKLVSKNDKLLSRKIYLWSVSNALQTILSMTHFSTNIFRPYGQILLLAQAILRPRDVVSHVID